MAFPLAVIAPLVGSAIKAFANSKDGKASGLTEAAAGAIENYLSKDEKLQKQLDEQVAKAREHDIATFDKEDRLTNRIRSLVRPVCTMAGVVWYIYARINGIELGQEDYTIVGGMLAFWFGTRALEKGK